MTKAKTKSRRVWLIFHSEWKDPVVSFSLKAARFAVKCRPNATMNIGQGILTYAPPAKAKKRSAKR
jgi:hypothetical protein